MPVHVEVRLVRLTLGFRQRRCLPRERDAKLVRSGLHRNPDLQILVDRFIRVVGAALVPVRFDGEQLQAIAIQRDLQLVRFAEPFDVFVAVSRQANLDLVRAVERERVADERAAARAERQAVDVVLLGQVRRQHDDVAGRRWRGAADRQPADFLRRRQVSLQQRRRQFADAHVVEAMARHRLSAAARRRRRRAPAGRGSRSGIRFD